MTSYTFHTDEGHGWLEVPVQDVLALGLTPGMFSPYSYREGATLFLEEDADATLFCMAYEAKHGCKVPHTVRHTAGGSPIRSLCHLAGEDYSFAKTGERIRAYSAAIAARAA